MHILLQSQLPGDDPESAHHGGHNLRRPGVAGKAVSIREQVAFQALRFGVQRGYQPYLTYRRVKKMLTRIESRLFNAGSDLKNARTLRNGQCPGKNIAPCDPAVDFERGRRMFKPVFAGPQRSPLPKAQQIKGNLGSDNAGCFELPANARRR